jgi:hypothetical protein
MSTSPWALLAVSEQRNLVARVGLAVSLGLVVTSPQLPRRGLG